MTLTPAEKQRRYRAKLRGEDIPKLLPGPPKGYKWDPSVIASKNYRYGADHQNWKGDEIVADSGHARARVLYGKKDICDKCKLKKKTEIHHKDGNPRNNKRKNITHLCRKCHMTVDGRLHQNGRFWGANSWRNESSR